MDTQDLSGSFQARVDNSATQQATADLDSILAGGAPQPTTPGPKAQPTEPSFVTKAVSGATKAAGDVAYGTAGEGAVQALGGVLDATGNVAKGLDHLGNWLNTNVADLSVDIPSSGNNFVDTIVKAAGDPFWAASQLQGAIPAAKTATGGFIREGAKFLAGFLPAMRAARAAGLGATGGSIVAGGIAGATVMDPEQPNLTAHLASNVKIPGVLKPVVDALATNPNDPEALNRARNAVENMGFGTITEGIFHGARAIATARRAASGVPIPPQSELDAMRAEYGEATPRDFMILGDPAAPAVSVRGPTAKQAADARTASRVNRGFENTDGRTEIPTNDGGAIYINFARIAEPEDVQNVMDKMATEFSRGIDVARRGVQSHEETAKLADELGLTVDDLLSRNSGEPFSAEKALAARRLWGASAQKLIETADKAAGPNAGAVDQFNFRKMMAIHYGVQQQVIAARTETARALNAWKIPASGGVEQMRAITALLDENGGSAVSTQLARRIASLGRAGVTPDGIGAAVRKGWAATTMDGVREAYVSGLLWAPPTHLTNIMSNSIVATQQIYERYAAEQFSAMSGGDSIAPGEAAAMLYSLHSSIRDAFTMAWRALKTGETGSSIGKTELPRERAISSGTGAFSQTALGKAVDYVGFANGIPGRLLASEDEFFKTIGYRMELHAQAVRTATAEAGFSAEAPAAPGMVRMYHGGADTRGQGSIPLWFTSHRPKAESYAGKNGRVFSVDVPENHPMFDTGVPGQGPKQGFTFDRELPPALADKRQPLDAQKSFSERVADITANPPENVRMAAADAALYNTFQNDSGRIVKALMALRDPGKALGVGSEQGVLGAFAAVARLPGTILLPFLKTPGNILSYTFERTPAAPFVARWRADVAAGGTRAELARARLSTGTMIMMHAFDLADSGLLTGAGPSKAEDKEALVRTGWQADSVKIGGKYVSYQRTDPLAMPLAFAATLAERFKQAEHNPEDYDEWSEAAAAAVAVVAETVTNKTWFQSISQLFGAIQSSREGPGGLTNYIDQQTGSLVPFSSLLREGKRFTDPVTRQVMNPYDGIIAGLPILSQTLPSRVDLWGADVKPDEVYGRAYDVLSPIAVREAKNSPIDAEMVRLQAGVARIGVKSTFDGVQVNYRDFPHVYNRYAKLAGNELKHPAWNLGAKDLLDQVVSGKSPLSGIYQRFSDEGKTNMIKQTIEEYRTLAQREIKDNARTDEEKRFLDYVQQKKDAAFIARMPQ